MTKYGKEVLKKLRKMGYEENGGKGSHVKMRKGSHTITVGPNIHSPQLVKRLLKRAI